MNDLVKVINKDGQLVVTSRQVAEDFEKRHDNVLKDIENLILNVGCPQKIGDLFIEDIYQHEQNKQWYKEYLLTKDGFSLLVMGFTGAKALSWKLKYIEAFNNMEEHIKKQIDTSSLSPELQMFKQIFDSVAKQQLEQQQIKTAVQETKEELQAVREVIEIKPSENWRSETNNLVKKICFKLGDYKTPKDSIYKALEERASCDLKRRLENMRARLLLNGGSKSKADNLNYLDVIAEDKKLIEIYTAIVKEMSIKNGIAA